MSHTEAYPIDFRFGIEIELITGSKTKHHLDWHSTAEELSAEFSKAGVKNHVNHDHDKKVEKYDDWSLIQEVSITNDMMQNQWGLELVSPVCRMADYASWGTEMLNMWRVLDYKFHTTTSLQCSTHIHLSPISHSWTLHQAKKIAQAAVYFERAIDSLVPIQRRVNIWCQSNRWNILFKDHSMSTIFSWIENAESLQHIVYYMCAYSKDSDYGKAVGKQTDFPHVPFRWNFTPLSQTGKCTVEFRQPPGSTSILDCLLWIKFVIGFVQGALLYADRLDPNSPATVQQLKSLVINGAMQSSLGNVKDLVTLFTGKYDLPQGQYDIKNASPEKVTLMLQKAKQKNITLEKFKALYGFK